MAGPGVYICDECVALSSHLIASKPKSGKSKPVQRIAPWDAEAGLDAVLDSLPRVSKAGEQAEYILTQYVRKKRVNLEGPGLPSDKPWAWRVNRRGNGSPGRTNAEHHIWNAAPAIKPGLGMRPNDG